MSSTHSILVIDDEANLRQTLTAILRRAGFQVIPAESVLQAREFLQKGAFDLVFLDLKMPGIGGMTLLPDLRQAYPEMPVLILTAHATVDSAMEAVRLGARDYLLKPVDPEQLLARVQEVLSEQHQPSRRREIVSQIQELLNELQQIDGVSQPISLPDLASPADKARFLHLGDLTLDLHTRRVTIKEIEIPAIPASSFDYLTTLVRHSPNPVPFETLVMEAQGYNLLKTEAREMARGHIHELRKAIESDLAHPRYIITVRDIGYRLVI